MRSSGGTSSWFNEFERLSVVARRSAVQGAATELSRQRAFDNFKSRQQVVLYLSFAEVCSC